MSSRIAVLQPPTAAHPDASHRDDSGRLGQTESENEYIYLSCLVPYSFFHVEVVRPYQSYKHCKQTSSFRPLLITICPHHHHGGKNSNKQRLNFRVRDRLLSCSRDRIMGFCLRHDWVSVPLSQLSLSHLTLACLIAYFVLLCALHSFRV